MTDKEKIKEEIESYKESMKGLEPHSDFRRGQITAYNQIMQFIDSLPEEHNEDLEEEIQRAYYDKSLYDADNLDRQDFNNIAHHFAEWQKEKHNKQFGFLNLKDCKDAYNRWKSTQDDNPSAALAWVRACEWQKHQMVKDAVELHIVESFNPIGEKEESLHEFTAVYSNSKCLDFYPIAKQNIKIIPISEEKK